MSKVVEARYLLAMRAHRNMVITKLLALGETVDQSLQVSARNEVSKAIWGTEIDADVVELLDAVRNGFAGDINRIVGRLRELNEADES